MEWISVKDKLPELDREVLATDGEYRYIAECYEDFYKNIHWRECCKNIYDEISSFDKPITHWMPLMELPK